MAANMGMAGNGHLLMQQQQQQQHNNRQRALQQLVYTALVSNTPTMPNGGWQSGMPINDRLGKTMNLISNVILAMPHAEWQKAATFSLEFEKAAFENSPDRLSYEQQMAQKTAEMLRRRNQQAPALQNQLSAEAAARQQQVQAQAQQQMMANQNAAFQAQMGQMAARGMVAPGQQGYQHLRGPMQASPIPQQPQMGMGAPGLQQPQPNQQFMMNMQQRSFDQRMAALTPQQRMHILDSASKTFSNQTEESRQQARQMVQARMTPQQLAEYRSKNQDPLMLYYQNQAYARAAKQQAMYVHQQQQQQQQQGMGPNANSAQVAMLQQQQQHQQQQQQQKQQMAMNPGLMNNMGPQPGMPGAQLFNPNMETIINEQKAGLLAEQSGQIVVPATNNGANRNVPAQPMGGAGAQKMSNGQGPTQNPRAQQMGQPFNLSQVKMNQAAAQSAAQNKAQAAAQQMQGQPGGLAGPGPTSQSPAMNTLTAPMTQPPVAMGGMGQVNGGRFNQGNPAMGQGLDQRFNHQANTRPISMSGNINVNSAALNQMLSALPADKRQNVSAMPPDKLRELMASWEQRNNMANGLMPQQPTTSQAQMGQMGQMGNQFVGNPQQTPNPNIPNNVQQQQQQMMQSQINRARTAATAAAIANNPQAQLMMDSMDVPQNVTTRLLRSGVPPDVKQWGQLKRWMREVPIQQNTQQQLVHLQMNQFREMMEKRQAAVANGALSGGPPQQPVPQPQPNQGLQEQQLQQNLPNLGPGMQIPPQVLQVTAGDIQSLRNDPRFANCDDQTLQKIAVRVKAENFRRALQARKQHAEAQQHQQQPSNGNAFGPAHQQQGIPAPQPQAPQADMNLLQTPQQQAQKPAANIAEPTAGGSKNSNMNNGKPAQNRTAPPKPSPAAAPKSLKRPSPDAVPEAPPANSAPVQKPEATRVTGTQPTPQQIATLSPEQRMRWQQQQRRNGIVQPDEQETKRMSELIKAMANEETAAAAANPHPDIQNMTEKDRQDAEAKLPGLVQDTQKVAKVIFRWFWIVQDARKLRFFFRMRARLLQQFSDNEMNQFRNVFSVTPEDLIVFRNLLSSMGQELTGRKPMPRPAGNGVATSTPAATAVAPPMQPTAPVSQQAPLNPANLEKHTQAMSKAHQRSNSKAGQAPAAPTTTQPPFPLGAQMSPTGQPTYFNKPSVTQDNLNPPPPRKKMKTSHQQASSPALQQPVPSPQVKTASPEIKRQPAPVEQPKAPARPLFVCPDAECEMHSIGFPNKEAVDTHYTEVHVRPYEDPLKYLDETMFATLGLGPKGHAAAQTGSVEMKSSGSKQGQTLGKLEPTSTPMSRNVSMGRQGSAQGVKAMDNRGTPGMGKSVQVKAENTPKPAMPAMQQDSSQSQPPTMEEVWANTTVDPQNLFATFKAIEPLKNGHMSQFTRHRSSTPNDTPDSSKDSGASEPTSDISEKAQLEIDMQWAPLNLDENIYANLDAMGGAEGLFGDGVPSWDELESEFSKYDITSKQHFELDPSMYSMTAL